MTLFTHRIHFVTALFASAAAGLCLWGMAAAAQQSVPGALETEELRTALDVARKQLAQSEKDKAVVQESLAEANRVSDEIRGQYEELLLRMAAFGVDLVKPDPKSLEQRLLSAVRDRDQSEQQKQELARHLAQLSEAVMAYLQTTVSSNPQVQAAVEAELTASSAALGEAIAPEGTSATQLRNLADGRVVSVDSEVGLLVLNVGRKSGVRVGMPINVKRDEKPICTAMIVDVRDAIAGALMQELVAPEDVKVGDRIEPRPDTL